MDGRRSGLMRALVTGAAGFSGRHACERLAAEGMDVTAVLSPRAGRAGERRPIAGASRELVCDLTDRTAVRSLLERARPDAVLHLAGHNAVDESWRAPDLTLAANLLSTVYLLEAARPIAGCRIVVAGSMLSPRPGEDLTRTLHPYGFSKALQVTAALAWHHWYGQQVIVAEPCNLIGPGGSAGICGKIARWAAACEQRCAGGAAPPAAGGGPAADAASADATVAGAPNAGAPAASGMLPAPFRLSSLDERRDFLDVRDAAAAYALLLRQGEPGVGYALESGTLRSLGEVKDAFDRASLVPLRWEIGASGAPSPQPRSAGAVRGLGWRPEIPFGRSIADTLQSERERLAGRS
ncbi:NAD-dependent epimerase/dehydratase family protein [Cohnella sp. 56]|uniref:NAD-dependent epimerase/dehydratase family protein n=1 Tax=Cohnella sp. 56 TaxID=3113722 RepID=UPI0030EAB210